MDKILYKTDFVRLIDGEIYDDLDTIYGTASLAEMLEEMLINGHKLLSNEKYVRMTDLREDQKTMYLNFLNMVVQIKIKTK